MYASQMYASQMYASTMTGNRPTENNVGQCTTPSPKRPMNNPVYCGWRTSQAVCSESVITVRPVKLAPALDENADANEQQRIAQQHRDQHAGLAHANNR